MNVGILYGITGLLWCIAGLISVIRGNSLLPYIPIGMMFTVLGVYMKEKQK